MLETLIEFAAKLASSNKSLSIISPAYAEKIAREFISEKETKAAQEAQTENPVGETQD